MTLEEFQLAMDLLEALIDERLCPSAKQQQKVVELRQQLIDCIVEQEQK